MIKVTFDTNTFDMATRPQVYAKDPNHADFVKVCRFRLMPARYSEAMPDAIPT
jgi:hypothetical protein